MINKKRYSSIDTLRGILIISVVIYHTIYDMINFYGFNIPWFASSWVVLWQRLTSFAFIILAGYCYNLSRSNLKRGILLSAIGLAITALTYFFYKEDIIIMGIISFIGLATLITIPIDKLSIYTRNTKAGFWCMLLFFVLMFEVPNGYIGSGTLIKFYLPQTLYANTFSAALGFPPNNFSSSDYFPFIPYYILFLAGYFLGKNKTRYVSNGINIPGINFIGRHTLIIYLIHQPLILIILKLIYSK